MERNLQYSIFLLSKVITFIYLLFLKDIFVINIFKTNITPMNNISTDTIIIDLFTFIHISSLFPYKKYAFKSIFLVNVHKAHLPQIVNRQIKIICRYMIYALFFHQFTFLYINLIFVYHFTDFRIR